MNIKLDSTIDLFILFIIFIKLVFVFSAIGHVLLTHLPKSIFGKDVDVKDAKLVYWKERTEFIFIVSMAILLIYYFRPHYLKPITNESALLFFLFGWILLITSDWNLFFKEAPWYATISNALQ
jgi:hypothetical protein